MHDLRYNPLRGQFILLLLLYFCRCYLRRASGACSGGGCRVIPPDVCQQIIRESPTFFCTREWRPPQPLKLTSLPRLRSSALSPPPLRKKRHRCCCRVPSFANGAEWNANEVNGERWRATATKAKESNYYYTERRCRRLWARDKQHRSELYVRFSKIYRTWVLIILSPTHPPFLYYAQLHSSCVFEKLLDVDHCKESPAKHNRSRQRDTVGYIMLHLFHLLVTSLTYLQNLKYIESMIFFYEYKVWLTIFHCKGRSLTYADSKCKIYVQWI